MIKTSRFVKQINLLSSNILKQQHITNHASSIKNLPLIYFSLDHKIIRLASSFTNRSSLSKTIKNDDTLIEKIKFANKSSDVLEIVRLNNQLMTIPQYLQALNSLFILQKNKKTKFSNEELTRSPEFTTLCHKIHYYSRNLELNDIMNAVKCLSYLGVSVNSNIMQILLQLLSKMINEMNLQQITFFQFLLKELPHCPLVEALKLSLPIIFEIQLRYKMENSIYLQVEYLKYTTKHELSQNNFDFIMSKIIQNINQLDFKIAKELLLCLYHKNYKTENYINEINTCLRILIDNIKYMTILDIEAILSKMMNKILIESDIFYDEQFINKIVEHIINKQESFVSIGYILKKLNKVGYVHQRLLNYVTDELNNNYAILEKSQFGTLLAYITSCAIGNYTPPGFVELKPHILKRLDIQKDVLELPWLMLTFDLAILDCWSEILLERVFSKHFLYRFLDRDNIMDYVMLLKLYQATITLYPGGYIGTLPPKEIIKKAIDKYKQNINDFPLKEPLEYGLGGKNYVQTGIRSKLGHFIDHLILMRPGGYPIAIKENNTSEIFLEDIVESSENLVIGILLYTPNSYVINTNRLRGSHIMTNKTIENLGVVVLPISMKVWNELMNHEKIPYIMRELKSKTTS